ncbi:hypothetical protein MUN78_06675 [Leucobacter allii]|uniref:RES domain-containing protein n=1 Tax=Leucobacter allii TaxID=2932247 RepID=A0ABY4FQE7_9MICO|nr:hypothetical protein [Leucobacter allii]UOQ58508.1 hypothetical protein MUN78_06675 [Leucobacter allii]UOR03091.1 hypothetical protein MUN77_07295 [Leucobacter allii]
MSETLPPPAPERFPELGDDPSWVRTVPAGALLARIFRAAGPYPMQWHEFREVGPLDGRFDPHPEPLGPHPGNGVLYGVLGDAVAVDPGAAGSVEVLSGAFAAAVVEVFQEYRIIRVSEGVPTLAGFRLDRPLRLLDLSDSDWISVAGGNAAISSGSRRAARAWARAIAGRYPDLDGVLSASSVIPSARIVALWEPARDALPRLAEVLIRLDSPELGDVLDEIAHRYGYELL